MPLQIGAYRWCSVLYQCRRQEISSSGMTSSLFWWSCRFRYNLAWGHHDRLSTNLPPHNRLFSFEIGLKRGAHHDKDSRPGFHGCKPSALPLSYPTTPRAWVVCVKVMPWHGECTRKCIINAKLEFQLFSARQVPLMAMCQEKMQTWSSQGKGVRESDQTETMTFTTHTY